MYRLKKKNSLEIFNSRFNNIRRRFKVTDGLFEVSCKGVGNTELVSCFGQRSTFQKRNNKSNSGMFLK